MNLLKYELYKILRQKMIYLLLLLFFGLLLLESSNLHYITEGKTNDYHHWEGKVTVQKLAKVNQENDKISKMLQKENGNLPNNDYYKALFKMELFQSINLLENVTNLRHQKIAQLEQKIKNAKDTDTHLIKKDTLERDMLEEIDTSQFYYNKGPTQTVDFINTFGLIMTGAMILIGLSFAFSNEYTTGVDQIIYSSKNGRKKIVSMKILAGIIYTTSIIVLWGLFSYISKGMLFGFSGWDTPIQSFINFKGSPYNFTFKEYFMLGMLIHWLAAIGFMLCVFLVSMISKNTFISFLVNGFIFSFPILITKVITLDVKQMNVLMHYLQFTYTNMMKIKEMFNAFNVYTIMGQPILQPYVDLVVLLIVSLFIVLLLYRTNQRKEIP